MANRLELRSTFQLSADGVGTMNFPTESGLLQNSFITSSRQDSQEIQELSRKNNFAVSTTISQAIINGLGEDLRGCIESYSSKKFASLLNNTFDGTSRHLALSDIRESVVGYDFNPEQAFDAGVSTKFCVRKGQHSGHVIFHVPAFVPQKDFNIPEGATNFKICARLIAVSDFEKSGSDFHTRNIRQHGQVASYQTPMLPLLRITTQPITTQLRISNPGFSPVGISSVLILGLKFYHYGDKKFSRLADHTRLKVWDIL